MARASIVFLVLALTAVFFGSYGIAGISVEKGKVFLLVFLAIASLSFIGSLIVNRKNRTP